MKTVVLGITIFLMIVILGAFSRAYTGWCDLGSDGGVSTAAPSVSPSASSALPQADAVGIKRQRVSPSVLLIHIDSSDGNYFAIEPMEESFQVIVLPLGQKLDKRVVVGDRLMISWVPRDAGVPPQELGDSLIVRERGLTFKTVVWER